MKELYWITVLWNIKGIAAFTMVTALAIFVGLIFTGDDEYESKYHIAQRKRKKKKSKRIRIALICLQIVSLACFVFIPTKEEMYVIYGVGTTIDYLKENDTAKQLPDKTIKALDKWLDSIIEKSDKQ